MTANASPELRALANGLLQIDQLNRKVAAARGASADSFSDSAERDRLHQANDDLIRELATSLVVEDLPAAHKMMSLLPEEAAEKARAILKLAEGESTAAELFGSSAGSRMSFVLEPLSSPGTSAAVLDDLNFQQAQFSAQEFVDSFNHELARAAVIRKGVRTIVTEGLRSELAKFDVPPKVTAWQRFSQAFSRSAPDVQRMDERTVLITDARENVLDPLQVLDLKSLAFLSAEWQGSSYRRVELRGNIPDETRRLWQTVKNAERTWATRMERVIERAYTHVVGDLQLAQQTRERAAEVSGSIADAVTAEAMLANEPAPPEVATARTRTPETSKESSLGL